MDKKSDPNLWKYLVFAGALGLSYLMVNYLSKARNSKLRPLPIEKTKQALRQIKYQLLTTCNSYAEAVNKKTNGQPIQQDLEIAFRTEVARLYEGREQVVLEKLDVSKEEYAASLETHKKNPKIEQDVNEIISMMERTIKGRCPDMSVPAQASDRMGNADLCQVYFEMCEMISIRMWEKLEHCKKNNPSFNSRDELHYKKAMKELSIYQLKWDFLISKGFQQSWGSPNEIFYKLLETQKQRSEEVKAKCIKIEKSFDKVIEKVTQETENLNQDRIKFILTESMREAEAPKPFNGGVAISKSVGVPSKKKDEDDLDALMMQELMNRSAEQPQEEPQKEQKISQPEEKRRLLRKQTELQESPLKKEDESAAAPIGGAFIVQPAEGTGQIAEPKRRPLYSKQTLDGWIQDEEEVGASQVGGVVIVNRNEDKTEIIDPPPRKISEEQWDEPEEQEEKEQQFPEPAPRQNEEEIKTTEKEIESREEIPPSPVKKPEEKLNEENEERREGAE